MVKKIDKLVSSSFIGPYILSFFVAEFVLIMQFLWKYIDEILGKGFTMFELMELILYYGITIIPMAVPITILIASVMVFGDMSEKHELSSMKSAGVSLIRIMGAGIVIAVFTAFFSLFASNYLKPLANYQFQKKFIALRKQKSALSIEEKVFNDDFKSYIIRVNEIKKDGRTMEDVLLYDHTDPDRSKINLIRSSSGEMYNSEDGRFFIMNLKDGEQYRELSSSESNKKKYSLIRTQFEEYVKVFDMSEFDMDENSLNINRNKEDMLNTFQLVDAIDSLENQIELNKKGSEKYSSLLEKELLVEKTAEDSIRARAVKRNKGSKSTTHSKNSKKQTKEPRVFQVPHDSIVLTSSFLQTLKGEGMNNVLVRSASKAKTEYNIIKRKINAEKNFRKSREKYILKLHQQYSWALVCIIFLFIGAPLGSIIRKGGYGYPLLVAILFYMIFIITTIMGQKMLKSQTMNGILAAWIPCIILSPFAVFLTYQALRDAKFKLISFSFLTRKKGS